MKTQLSNANGMVSGINIVSYYHKQNASIYKVLFMSLLLFFMQVNVFGQSAWKLSTDKEGIKIYTSQVPDSKVKAIKVECEVNATQSQLVALLMDINSSTEWVYHVKSSALVKQVSPSELYYYCEVNLPWPTGNRDFVAHLTVTQDPDTKIVVIDGPAVPGMAPEKKGIVRINNSTGRWTITPEGSDQVKIEYTLHVEPGGNIPSWLVNMFATEGPLQIFKKLKTQVQKPAYKNAVLPFIENKQYALNTKF
jgi:START domain